MQELRYDKTKVAEYREAAMKHHDVLSTADKRMDQAIEDGDKRAAEAALAEVTASGEAFRDLRSKLTRTDLFVAKYNIEVHGPHEVSFVLPLGVSRYEMILEAHGLVQDRDKRDLVWERHLSRWESEPRFTASCEQRERIRIDGHVEGGDGKTRPEQEQFLRENKLEQAQLEDLAAAFVAHYVATGGDLFERQKVRAVGGGFFFRSEGLMSIQWFAPDEYGEFSVGFASRVRPPSPCSGGQAGIEN